MNSIKMNRLELLKIVQDNKVKHIDAYAESKEDYKILVLQYCTQNLKLAKLGNIADFTKIKSVPSAPVSYEQNYNRAIRMLELSVEEIIDVEEDVFNQLVLDEWGWKHSFVASSTLYKTAIGGAV